MACGDAEGAASVVGEGVALGEFDGEEEGDGEDWIVAVGAGVPGLAAIEGEAPLEEGAGSG